MTSPRLRRSLMIVLACKFYSERLTARLALEAIFFVLSTGCQWKALPRELGASSTVHDRFQAWCEQGVFERLWQAGKTIVCDPGGHRMGVERN
ncbi:MAG: transposase [Gloeocapsa sp. UFS-A4-WI-NPMV-4B04]|nr:transposase [Gloeocapsa sp. UFS-A4-WI-NPMV-4B04]